MAKLIILCGLPGSGKSQYALNYKAVDDAICTDFTVIHSSDAIREELFGDPGSQENNALVFETMHKRVKEDLRAGKTVIYDATNVTRKARRGAINLASKNDIVECHIVWAPIQTCITRDRKRERSVGNEVIDKMLRRWQSPHKSEGFDKVTICCTDNDFDQVKYVAMHTSQMGIPHDNPHHTLGVWEHCIQAYCNIEQCAEGKPVSDALRTAALWHDIGKPYTKGYKADKETGLIDYSVAHYYDHHCVGGYLSYGLFMYRDMPREVDVDQICYISWLISTHMDPFFDTKYYRELPEGLKREVDLLHAADMSAH